jgi:3-oxoacyl-[acyl-carrier-protein] synthase II
MIRRVVVTGMGVVTPLGNELNTLWNKLIQLQSGIVDITKVLDEPDKYNIKIAGISNVVDKDISSLSVNTN